MKDLDFERPEILVRRGKGQKDRRTMLPTRIEERLRAHLGEVQGQHERDLANGFGRVVLPFARSAANRGRPGGRVRASIPSGTKGCGVLSAGGVPRSQRPAGGERLDAGPSCLGPNGFGALFLSRRTRLCLSWGHEGTSRARIRGSQRTTSGGVG